VVAIQERAEILAKHPEHKESYDFVVSRATAYITDILTWAKPFLAKNGRIILYKMPSDEEERDRNKILAKLGLFLEGELPYTLGGRERCILVIRTAK
jgi:16S rRNA (guanine527-N7)-methyltransferase